MSLIKRSPGFDRLMEEAMEYDDLSHERFAEELYLNSRKGKMPQEPTQHKENKPATTVAQQPKR